MNTYSEADAPSNVLEMEREIMARFLAGDTPFLARLREQYAVAEIESVELSGVGFFINYRVPETMTKTEPLGFSGGAMTLTVSGLRLPAGCALFVSAGYLSMLDVYIHDDAWPEDARLTGIEEQLPPDPTY